MRIPRVWGSTGNNFGNGNAGSPAQTKISFVIITPSPAPLNLFDGPQKHGQGIQPAHRAVTILSGVLYARYSQRSY